MGKHANSQVDTPFAAASREMAQVLAHEAGKIYGHSEYSIRVLDQAAESAREHNDSAQVTFTRGFDTKADLVVRLVRETAHGKLEETPEGVRYVRYGVQSTVSYPSSGHADRVNLVQAQVDLLQEVVSLGRALELTLNARFGVIGKFTVVAPE